jgi:hypothetical protein
MLKIKEAIADGYYVRTMPNGSEHLYYIHTNDMGSKILAYIVPASKSKEDKISGRIDVCFDSEPTRGTAVVNQDGCFKEVTGYTFDQIIFNDNLKGYYLAWVEKNKCGTGIVYRDLIDRGSHLRIVVSEEMGFPRQLNMFHSKNLTMYGMQGVYGAANAEFDCSGQRGKSKHLLIRVEYMYPVTEDEMPKPYLYQRIIKVNERKTIVYTVVPILLNVENGVRPVTIKDMFLKNPCDNKNKTKL